MRLKHIKKQASDARSFSAESFKQLFKAVLGHTLVLSKLLQFRHDFIFMQQYLGCKQKEQLNNDCFHDQPFQHFHVHPRLLLIFSIIIGIRAGNYSFTLQGLSS
jgi:hypothetical protein